VQCQLVGRRRKNWFVQTNARSTGEASDVGLRCKGRSAKELSVLLVESKVTKCLCTHLEHENYVGREMQRAEFSARSLQSSLLLNELYVQD
jgi:hypothetical protein